MINYCKRKNLYTNLYSLSLYCNGWMHWEQMMNYGCEVILLYVEYEINDQGAFRECMLNSINLEGFGIFVVFLYYFSWFPLLFCLFLWIVLVNIELTYILLKGEIIFLMVTERWWSVSIRVLEVYKFWTDVCALVTTC